MVTTNKMVTEYTHRRKSKQLKYFTTKNSTKYKKKERVSKVLKKEMLVHPSSSQHYSQLLKHGNTPRVHQ